MKIENKLINNKKELISSHKKNVSSQSFNDFLQKLEFEDENLLILEYENFDEQDLKNLSGIIDQIGDELSKNPNPTTFIKYKNAIKVFLKLIQKNYEVKETLSRINFSKQKLFKTIEIIDENLHKISQNIMNQEKNRIIYLNLVNNIKGLIIDLIM